MEGEAQNMQQLQEQLQCTLQQINSLQQQIHQLQEEGNLTTGQHVAQVQQLEAQIGNLQVRVRPASAPSRFDATARQIRDLDMWLRSVRNWLATQGVTHPYFQIMHAVDLFGVVPLRWWNEIAPNPEDMPFHSWQEFEAALKLHFPVTVTEAEARQQLYTMQQRPGQSFMEFLSHFLSVSGRISGLTDTEKYHCLFLAVKPTLRAEIARQGERAATFDQAVAVCSRMAAIEALARLPSSGMGQGRTGVPAHRPAGHGVAPMELGMMRTRAGRQVGQRNRPRIAQQGRTGSSQMRPRGPPTWGLSAAELVSRRAENRCYRCGEVGHPWRACPNGR